MHLAEYLALRPVPAAGVVLALTGRCPLHCAHCSTDSTAAGTDVAGGVLVRFAETFGAGFRGAGPPAPGSAAGSGSAPAPAPTSGSGSGSAAGRGPDSADGALAGAPAVALLTGGEPLLRPRLVRQLAERCRAVGTASFLLTGLFYARATARGASRDSVPAPIAAALAAVDHVSASLDAFHEREVPRGAVFAELHRLLAAGKDVSLHVLGAGPSDPYPDRTAAAVRAEFGTRVPILVGRLAPVGRGRSLGEALTDPAAGADGPGGGGTLPCAMAAWPVVGMDGTITACCNQHVLDRRPVPPHLLLGHADRDGWPAVRARTVNSPALRAIRTLGPDALTSAGTGGGGCAGCRALRPAVDGGDPVSGELAATVAALEAPVAQLQSAAGATGFTRRYGDPRHADLVLLGHRPGSRGSP
ncbi:radical SAM protein [Streptomyces sp. CA-111067]|uniref:radical SAM protein n=1 Tax=Streptomyces sp. CA-111067 TaxID=3240046 RepID=UPI003D97CDFF